MRIGYGNAKSLRHRSTDAELLLWSRLRNRRIDDAKFRRQQPIGQYVVDFVCMEHRLVIELDGGQHTEQVESDEVRTAYLKAKGYRVLRYWNNEVLGQTESVLEAIHQALTQAAYPSPRPSPARGEGAGSRDQ